MLAKTIYAIANPCSSHLVDRVHVWPGVESLTAIEEEVAFVVSKPSRIFDKANGDLPVVVCSAASGRLLASSGEPMRSGRG